MIVEDIELISLFEANLFKICNRVKFCLFFLSFFTKYKF